MYFTHHFAHPETLSRARSWLAQLGFGPHQFRPHAEGTPRITMTVDPHQLAEIRFLINALERSDPDGFPSFWDDARRPHAAPVVDPAVPLSEGQAPPPAIIGWHPPDAALATDPELHRLREVLGH